MAVTDAKMDRSFHQLPAGPVMAAAKSEAAKARLPMPVKIYLLTVVLPITFQLGPLNMTTLRLFLLVMILPVLARLLVGHYGKVFLTDILFLAHILWATAALAVNNPDQVIQQIGSVGIEFIGGYVLARAYIRTKENFIALCRWLVVLVCLTTPFALFEAQTGRPLIIEFLRKLPSLSSVAIVTIEGRLGLERVQAVFAHPIHYGLFCSVAFSLGFVALKGITPTVWRWFSSIVVAGSGFLALSSGALLAIVLQIALILWATVFVRIRWRWWLLVGLFAVAYVLIDILSNRTPMRVFMSYATFSAHNAYWRSIIFEWGMKNAWGSPFFGIGLNDWVRPFFMYSGSMDNFWLVMAVRYGFPGLILLATGYAWSVFLIIRRNFEADETLGQFRRAWVFTMLGLAFTLSTVHVWTNIYSFVFFMFGAGMWLVTAENANLVPSATKTGPSGPQGGRSRTRTLATGPISTNPAAEPADAPPGTRAGRESPSYSRFPPRARASVAGGDGG